MAVAATGGTQSAALLVSRCRLGSGDECLCKVLAEESKELCEEQYRVATLTTSNETATETMTTAQFLRHRFSRLVSRSIFKVTESPSLYHIKLAARKQVASVTTVTSTAHKYLDNPSPRRVARSEGFREELIPQRIRDHRISRPRNHCHTSQTVTVSSLKDSQSDYPVAYNNPVFEVTKEISLP